MNSASPENNPPKPKKGYPEPLIVLPSTRHSHSIILLHGRGSNASRFGLEFLKAETSTGKTLGEIYPGTKWIFPTAKKRRATAINRTPINQWFDMFSAKNPSERQELQYDGLRETSVFMHGLICEEAKAVGLRNVVIGGLSQGCAMSLHVVLHYEPTALEVAISGEAAEGEGEGKAASLGGYIGMSGWLPFAEEIHEAAAPIRYEDDEDEDDPFGHTETRAELDDSHEARRARVANFARDLVDLEPLDDRSKPWFAQSSYFLGHGKADEKVPVYLGVEMRDFLLQLGLDVTWKAYDEFGHRYKEPDEIDDIAQFLGEKCGFIASGESS